MTLGILIEVFDGVNIFLTYFVQYHWCVWWGFSKQINSIITPFLQTFFVASVIVAL